MRRSILIILSLLSISTISLAQTPVFEWGASMGGVEYNKGYTVVVDIYGSVYTMGKFDETVDFDPGSGVYNLTCDGIEGLFVSKLNSSGTFSWAKQISGETGNDYIYGTDMVIDTLGNIYITGYFSGTIDFNPGTTTNNISTTFTSSISTDVEGFILKLDIGGNYIWCKHFAYSSSSDKSYPKSIAINETSGIICIVGQYKGTVDFCPGSGVAEFTSHSIVGNDVFDTFVVRFTSTGVFLSASSYGGQAYDRPNSVTFDLAGNIIIAGQVGVGFTGISFNGTTDMDPGIGVSNITGTAAYIQKLNPSGSFLWVKSIAGMHIHFNAITTDVNDNICYTGSFNGTKDFDLGIGVSNLSSSGNDDIFISKMDQNGNFEWAHNMGSTGEDIAYDIAIDEENNIYATGKFRGSVDFDPGTGNTVLTANGVSNIFITKFNQVGDLIWAKDIGDPGEAVGQSITVNHYRDVFITGCYYNTIDLDPNSGVSNVTSIGHSDIITIKLGQPIFSTSLTSDIALNVTAAPSYYTINNTYSKWGAVGVRADDSNNGFWALRFYSNDDFLNMLEGSNYSGVNFVIYDQHHLVNLERGVEAYRFGTGDARIEFEGYTETITENITTTHAWPANDVVEIWDIYLTPGTYNFTMNYNSGSANLDMALFGSLGGPYFQDRYNYIASSENSGTNNESFLITVSNSDHYGFVVWANDANVANVDIHCESVIGGIWEGDLSTNWNTAGNWSDNNVPSSTTDVVIPAGTTYSPTISGDNAYAKTLTIESGAILTLGQYDLDVQNETHVFGTINLSHSNSDMRCYGDIYWESGSQASSVIYAEFRIYGNWNFQPGANVQLDHGRTWFVGTSSSFIRSYASDCYFNHVYSQKPGAYIGISSFSSQDLIINGDLTIYSGSTFNSYSNEKIILNGSLVNNGGYLHCDNGTFEFAGTPIDNLEPNVGDYFNDLIINVTTDVNFINTYSDSLVIKGNLLIQSGILKPTNNTIVIAGNWINSLGSYGFWEGVGTVIFNATSGNQYCYTDNFYDVIKTTDGGLLYFYGPVNINNNYYCNGFSWAGDSSLYIDNLFLTSTGYLTATSNTNVNIDDLDMGSSGSYGTLTCTGGDITVADIVENGLFGTFAVHDSVAVMDITQGTSGGEFVDLNGTINISAGTMNIHGGTGDSYWPYADHATITMSGGVLDFTDVDIRIQNSLTYSLTTNITGGIIRLDDDLKIYAPFNPAGGTFEFYGAGTSDIVITNSASPSSLYNLHVNKISGIVDCDRPVTTIRNNIVIDGGMLDAPTDTLYVGGNWTNNVGTSGFDEGTDVVCFYGNNESDITTNETFNNLAINKNCSGYTDLELLSGLQINITNNLHPIAGTFKLGDYSTVDINGDLIIESGAGVNLLNFNTSVYLAEDFTDNNLSAGNSNGFIGNKFSTLVFDGTASQDFSTVAPQILLGNITIDKPISTFVNFADDVRMLGNLNILSGSWDEYSFSNNYYLEGDFYIAANGRWTDYESTLHFEGNVLQIFEDLSTSGCLGNTVVNLSNPLGGVEVHSLFKIFNFKELNINNGKVWLNGNIMRIIGNININNNGVLDMDDDSELQIGGSGQLNINAGGKLNAIGTENHEVIINSNDASFWKFEGLSGSTVAAEWVEFSDMDEWGVNIYPGCFIDGSYPFNHCTFFEGEPNGVRFWINNNQGHYIYYANFPNQGASLNNAAKFFNNGQITFVNYLGNFSGEAYDADPYNRVIWTSNIYFNSGITDISCYGDNDGEIEITVTGGTSPYTYLWSDGQTIEDRSGLSAGTYSITVTDHYGASNSESFTITETGYLFTIPSLTIIEDVSCNGGSDGSVTPSFGGGTPPYTYLWATGETSASISGITTGVYAVTFTDVNGCFMNAAWVVSEPDAMYWSATIIDVSTMGGNDGSIDFAIAGGTYPNSYLWSNGATTQDIFGLTAGNYTLTITDGNGCIETVSYTINAGIQILTISGISTNPTCNGWYDGTINTIVDGGTPPYYYIWSDGSTLANRTGLNQGTYTVTVTDGSSQTATNSWTIIYPPGVYFTYSINNINCNGGSDGDIFVTPQGGTGIYNIVWGTGYTGFNLLNQTAGYYNCTITDTNGCLVLGGFSITEPSSLNISDIVTNVTSTGGSDGAIDITITGGELPYTYLWSNGALTEDIVGLSSGFYSITVTDFNGCIINDVIEITEPGGFDIQNIDLISGWSIISTYIDPIYPAVDSVFAPVASSTSLVKNSFGQVYWPGFYLNMIGNMIIGQGYQVNMTSYELLSINGTAVVPELTPILIQSGWGIIGYLRQNPGDAIAMMSTIVTDLVILKDGSGQVYWPGFSLNMIGNLLPGGGYQCNLYTEATLTYPANSILSKSNLINAKPIFYSDIKITGNNMTLGIPLYAFNHIPEQGSEIGVFDLKNNLVGSSVFEGNNMAITIWGDDEYSSEIDGILSGDEFYLSIWNGNSQQPLIIESWQKGNGLYKMDDIQIANKVIINPVVNTSFYLSQNIPNPFKDETIIEFYLPESTIISLTLFDVLGNEVKDIANGEYKKGKHEISINSRKMSSGIYLYQLTTKNFSSTKKMKVAKE